jgi:phosphoribosylformylglycinamidine synthase
MKAHVYVSPKKTVLDPQGKTIHSALQGLGFHDVTAVRQGKHFELELAPDLSQERAREEVERIAREVLTNPVIEEFSYRLEATPELDDTK